MQTHTNLDRQDGAHAIEVTTMLGDSVLEVEHLTDAAAGKVSALSWVAVVTGALMCLSGVAIAIYGAATHHNVLGPGLGGLELLVGLCLLVLGLGRMSRENRSPHFSVGEAVASSITMVDPSIPAPNFPLVQSTGTDYQLNYTQGMTGDVTIGAHRIGLDQLAASGAARPGMYPGSYGYPIPPDARIKLDLGASTFLVNSVRAARKLPGGIISGFDANLGLHLGLAFAAHTLALFMVFAVPPDPNILSLDLFDAESKLVSVLIKPADQKQEEVPGWLQRGQKDEQGGTGKRHKDQEGKMGKKTSREKTGLYGLKGPKDTPNPQLAKRLAKDAASTAGVLGLLRSPSGSHLASIFGRDRALGQDAVNALGGLIGDQIGEAYGIGGLGLTGTGRGGGGTGEGTIGLDTTGTLGKGGGGGGGAGYGRGVGRLTGRRIPLPPRVLKGPRVVAGRAAVRGTLSKEIIRRVIRQHINEVKYCYQRELQSNPGLYGRLIVQFTISGMGKVVVSRVARSTLGNSNVETCIAQAVRRWPFPRPQGGGIVVVTYPFVLNSPRATPNS
jgi:hypothetical protein